MTSKPNIIVTIVHIEGPLKGEIQEFSDDEIRIGRNIGYHVQFPRDVLIVSRDHAKIVRDGNRFKIINHSENLTFLNGKPLDTGEEAYLKSGDWLMFAQDGPKISFLTKIDDSKPAAKPAAPGFAENKRVEPEPMKKRPVVSDAKEVPAPDQQTQQPLVIRYGPMLKRFNSLPVILGNSDTCDFNLKNNALNDKHIQIFFSQGDYWIKDLTGRKAVLINGRPVEGAQVLMPDDQMDLSGQGPRFRFLAGGRLDEVS